MIFKWILVSSECTNSVLLCTDHELEATKCEMSLHKMKSEKIHDLIEK
jgi:hypothetical protein